MATEIKDETDSILDGEILDKVTDEDYDEDGFLFKDIFEPDYLKPRDLSAGKVHEPLWHWYAIEKIEQELRRIGSEQVGVIFIRRRLAIHGLSLLEEQNLDKIKSLRESYAGKLEDYNPLKLQMMRQTMSFGDKNGKRTMLYLEENSFAHIREIAKIFSVTIELLERIAMTYSIVELEKYIGEKVTKLAKDEIEEFRSYIGLIK